MIRTMGHYIGCERAQRNGYIRNGDNSDKIETVEMFPVSVNARLSGRMMSDGYYSR